MTASMTLQADRAVGALLGLAVGDALGAALEFSARDSLPEVRDLIGGGPFGLKPGEWTDDTSMALCLADSLIACRRFDGHDLLRRFVRWWREGENSVTGACFDIGATTRESLARYEADPKLATQPPHPGKAGNGSLMRLAPAAIFAAGNTRKAEFIAERQSRTTHPAPVAHDACRYFARLLTEAMTGEAKDEVLKARPWDGSQDVAPVAAIAAGGWRGKARGEISSSGYVVHTLEAALWCVHHGESFEEALILAANLGDDSDTVAAVTGQLAGALWGRSAIPERWLERLAWRERIELKAEVLLLAGEMPDFVVDEEAFGEGLSESVVAKLRETASGRQSKMKWEPRLAQGYKDYAEATGVNNRNVRLPAKGIDFLGDGADVVISMDSESVHKNMQDNCAAFEGWSLALKRWAGASQVTLTWVTPTFPKDAKGENQRRHYNRFLYRADRFNSLFDWFHVEGAERLLQAPTASGAPLYLNAAGERGVPEFREHDKAEYRFELELLKGPRLRHIYNLCADDKDRQFPVGVFDSAEITNAAGVFPGGKGAIDLVALEGDVLWLFELKAEDNIAVGAISELFFYTSLLRDAIGDSPFKLPPANAIKLKGDLKQVTHIEAVILGHKLHPLIADRPLLDLLNDGVRRKWRGDGRPSVTFRADTLSPIPEAA